jgi:hypothetical protein
LNVALAISCSMVEEAPKYCQLLPFPKKAVHTPWLIVCRLAHLGLHLGIVHDRYGALAVASWHVHSAPRTILCFPEPGLEVVEREIAHLIFEAVQIHGGGVWWAKSRSVVGV